MRIRNRKIVNRKLLFVAGAVAAAVVVRSISKRPRRYSGMKLKRSIEVDRPAAELYAFWRQVENLPKLADVLTSVESIGGPWSRWTIHRAGTQLSWESEVTVDRENEMIGWRSAEGSDVETAGYVRFERAPGGRGTLVRVAMEYDLPAGRVGAALATLLGKRPGAHVEEMLRRFRQVMETGEAAIAERQFAT